MFNNKWFIACCTGNVLRITCLWQRKIPCLVSSEFELHTRCYAMHVHSCLSHYAAKLYWFAIADLLYFPSMICLMRHCWSWTCLRTSLGYVFDRPGEHAKFPTKKYKSCAACVWQKDTRERRWIRYACTFSCFLLLIHLRVHSIVYCWLLGPAFTGGSGSLQAGGPSVTSIPLQLQKRGE